MRIPAIASSIARYWPRSGVTCGSCSRSLPHEVATDEFLPGGDELRDTLLGWLVSDVAANAVRPAGRTLAAAIARFKCTAVTAPHGRSTSFARYCSVYSPTTPTRNRATSW